MLEIQKFLQSGGTFEQLTEQFAIKCKPHSKYSNLVLFKYDQIHSNFTLPLVRECRGIILDKDNDWAVVSRSFDKFFNYGEGHASAIDWGTAKVQEKYDGSLMTAYFYDGAWQVATTGTPDASGDVQGHNINFAQLFWKTLAQYNMSELEDAPRNICFFFEMMTPLNRVVVRHLDPKLVLLGARNIESQRELSAHDASQYFPSVPSVKEFPLNSFDAIVESLTHIDPLAQEGYVVVDANFNRNKVKSVAYVALHHMKDGLCSQRSLVKVALNGEIDEVLVAFPEYKEQLVDIRTRLDNLVSDLTSSYDKIKAYQVQKDFALEAVKSRSSGALFAKRKAEQTNSELSFIKYLQNIQVDNVIHLLGLKIVKEEKVEE